MMTTSTMETGFAGITIQVKDGKTYCESPYHPDFVKSARNLNGRWAAPYWTFDARDEARVREACRSVYGTDGTPVPVVTVRYDLQDDEGFPAIYCLGRCIASRKARDYRATLGDGVVVVEGGFPSSGGSMKHPALNPRKGTVIEVRDVPLSMAQRWMEAYPDQFSIIGETEPEATIPELTEEIITRLADIPTELLRAEVTRREGGAA